MTKEELSLLLYLETCAVDQSGKIVAERMNAEDIKIARGWNNSGYVRFGRIRASEIKKSRFPTTYWCELSDKAWEDAHDERKARAARTAHDPLIRAENKALLT